MNAGTIYNVGLGHIQVSKQPGAVIKALALGSCIAVVVVAPRYRAAGMAHIVLPSSEIDKERARSTPGYFADTGIPALLDCFRQAGIHSFREARVNLVGGAQVLPTNQMFDIGKRNISACREALGRQHMTPAAEDVGANFSRTVSVEVSTGHVYVSSTPFGKRKL